MHSKLFPSPWFEYAALSLLVIAFVVNLIWLASWPFLAVVSLLGVLPTFAEAAMALWHRRITIDVFNTLAIGVAFSLVDFRSSGFIALMLVSARYLDWRTMDRTRRTVEELLKLKPLAAHREIGQVIQDVPVDQVKRGDVILVPIGSRVPVDGEVVFGQALVNEASVTGEAAPVDKLVGDFVLSSSLIESGTIKIRATRVGKDSTIERMVALMKEAAEHKSRPEKIADRFAAIFLPAMVALAVVVYLLTRDLTKTASLFLVACADDLAMAIPLAMTASFGAAAKRGVLIKGGQWLERLAKLKILVLDKTGTLTYGSVAIERLADGGVPDKEFWPAVAMAEKFSEHPIGRLLYRELSRRVGTVPDPREFRTIQGQGVTAHLAKQNVAVGNADLAHSLGLHLPPEARALTDLPRTVFHVFINKKYAGSIGLTDTPRPEAAQSLRELKRLGVARTIMFTGDNERRAAEVAKVLGLDEYQASLQPEEKLRKIQGLLRQGTVGMVGDGINDAPALARADVGIAMGGTGTAVATEAADVVILTDNLNRLPEMIRLGRRTMGVIRSDIWLWSITNLIGFVLVLSGTIGPALAAFYNMATDFFPLINSSRLFRWKTKA